VFGRISKPTVLILGAGASKPYGFPTGEELFDGVRQLQVHEVSDEISPSQSDHAGPLQLAVRSSLHRSLDAMLERRSELVEAGKAYTARRLLRAEAAAREAVADAPGTWYHILWDAMDLASLEAFRATPLKIITYNYDRSLEYALVSGLTDRQWDTSVTRESDSTLIPDASTSAKRASSSGTPRVLSCDSASERRLGYSTVTITRPASLPAQLPSQIRALPVL
jgi:hypothetical protein